MSEPSAADIENLIELFKQSEWEEMHVKTDGLEVFLSNDPRAVAPSARVASVAPAPAAPTAAADAPAPTAAAPASSAAAGPAEVSIPPGMIGVSAPNLGTFYRAPKPGAPSYVEVGQSVTADTEVCLIEVMKLFTPVKAGVDGIVREICVNDGAMVEFEQILVIIEPAA